MLWTVSMLNLLVNQSGPVWANSSQVIPKFQVTYSLKGLHAFELYNGYFCFFLHVCTCCDCVVTTLLHCKMRSASSFFLFMYCL